MQDVLVIFLQALRLLGLFHNCNAIVFCFYQIYEAIPVYDTDGWCAKHNLEYNACWLAVWRNFFWESDFGGKKSTFKHKDNRYFDYFQWDLVSLSWSAPDPIPILIHYIISDPLFPISFIPFHVSPACLSSFFSGGCSRQERKEELEVKEKVFLMFVNNKDE